MYLSPLWGSYPLCMVFLLIHQAILHFTRISIFNYKQTQEKPRKAIIVFYLYKNLLCLLKVKKTPHINCTKMCTTIYNMYGYTCPLWIYTASQANTPQAQWTTLLLVQRDDVICPAPSVSSQITWLPQRTSPSYICFLGCCLSVLLIEGNREAYIPSACSGTLGVVQKRVKGACAYI